MCRIPRRVALEAAAEAVPLAAEAVPSAAEAVPLAAEAVPLAAELPARRITDRAISAPRPMILPGSAESPAPTAKAPVDSGPVRASILCASERRSSVATLLRYCPRSSAPPRSMDTPVPRRAPAVAPGGPPIKPPIAPRDAAGAISAAKSGSISAAVVFRFVHVLPVPLNALSNNPAPSASRSCWLRRYALFSIVSRMILSRRSPLMRLSSAVLSVKSERRFSAY